ncbi:sigma-54 dependent transcriptional regulator [Castellaniella daejeonensis]|uniref:Sigma-54 dependent transcriptional regulator n=1 Tax=Castellaniella daejeonensis TaxID=659013 RepID=A0ABP3DNA0_9BURK
MTVSPDNIDVFIWEGSSDIAPRIQQCLASTDIMAIRVDSTTPMPPPREPGRRAVAVISVSIIGDAHFTGQGWLRTEAVPVIWVAAEQRGQDTRFYPPAYSHTLPPSFTGAELRAMVLRAAQSADQADAAQATRQNTPLIAECTAMRTLMRDVELYAGCDASVVIHGETGTGKERIAQRLHELSTRAGGPFVAVNCGAVPDGLFEAHFFGHAKGAFTGAVGAHKGYFEQAHGGTLFLDEIGDLPLHQQVKLLRVLEQRSITRLGSTVQVPVDFRLVSASHFHLAALTEAGRFRSDLYYRLAVIELEVPNLEARGPLEKQHLFRALLSLTAPHGDAEPPEWLQAKVAMMPFPGNIREMANLAERIGIGVRQTGAWDRDLLERILDQFTSLSRVAIQEAPPSVSPDEQTERTRIIQALDDNGWRRQDTAAALGISRKALWEKMRRHGIQTQADRAVPL